MPYLWHPLLRIRQGTLYVVRAGFCRFFREFGSSGNFVAGGPGSRKIVGFTPGNVLVPAPAAPPLLQAGSL